jgi:trimethylamine---corrinoid protein Co-methyltransferase
MGVVEDGQVSAGGRRRERSGRAAQREARSHRSAALGRPYIIRNIPTYDTGLCSSKLIPVFRARD